MPKPSKAVRDEVFKRSHGLCTYPADYLGHWCGQPAITVDQIRAGQDFEPANLRALCHQHGSTDVVAIDEVTSADLTDAEQGDEAE